MEVHVPKYHEKQYLFPDQPYRIEQKNVRLQQEADFGKLEHNE